MYRAETPEQLHTDYLRTGKREDLDLGGDTDEATLWGAAQRGQLNVVERHLRDGTGGGIEEEESGMTPLGVAAQFNQADVAHCLLQHGAAIDVAGGKPLRLAVQKGALDAVAVLLHHSADVNARSARTGQTPLQVAPPQPLAPPPAAPRRAACAFVCVLQRRSPSLSPL